MDAQYISWDIYSRRIKDGYIVLPSPEALECWQTVGGPQGEDKLRSLSSGTLPSLTSTRWLVP